MKKFVFRPCTSLVWDLSLIRRFETLAPNPSKKRGFDSRLVIDQTSMFDEWKTISENFPNKEAALLVFGVNRQGIESLLNVYRIESSVLGWVRLNRKNLFRVVLAHFSKNAWKHIRFQIAYQIQAAA